ncbi:uncharacterized protein LOC105693586 [Athalia rosae]|uniref:uncharacterized protein LOC105693586 n=1 Tax=Athalia rosae TaxID=37344 RepID=UPI002034879B|nr:uncharacterized protein LOC105693586 [Athalia rosae]XP_048509559.1 uncharacterized protein LOC105693586 [Athalia rosae]
MVTIAFGAVAVGVFSAVCAIPIGCFLSRKMRKREPSTPHAANEESSASRYASRLSDPVEISNASERGSGGAKSLPARSERGPRIQVRVFFSDDSQDSPVGSTDVDSLGYVSAPVSSDLSSGARRRVSGAAIAGAEVKRMSLRHRRSERATKAAPSRHCSLPVTVTTPHAPSHELEPACQGVQKDDSTVLEISICGSFARGASTRFVEFRDDVPDSSTPESRRSDSGAVPNIDESMNSITCYRDPPVTRTHGFWRRAFFGRAKSRQIFTAEEDMEAVDALDESRNDGCESRRDSIPSPQLVGNVEEMVPVEEQSHRRNDGGSSSKTAGSSRDDGGAYGRSAWGIPRRFFETLKEARNFATI